MTLLGFNKQDIFTIFNIFKMNLRDKYLGSLLGRFWAIINPLIFLGIYTFIFGFIFKTKAPGSETTFSFAIWLMSGLIPYLAISEGMNTSSNSVVSGTSLVKNIVFKVECLPIASNIVAMVPFLIGMGFIVILLFIDGNYPTWHAVLLIPVIVLQFTFLVGIGFFLSATAVFIRDISQVIPTVTLIILFFSPIFYHLNSLPKVIQKITFFNPFHQIIQPYRDIIINHKLPDWQGILYIVILSAILNLLGLKYFRRLKGYFTTAL